MNLYLLRHAKAEKSNVLYNQDHARPLTQDAIQALERAAGRIGDIVPHLDRILTSPLLRARQTAEIIASAYGEGIQTIALDVLDGSADPEAIANLFRDLMGDPSILIVGHAPNLDNLIRYLVAPNENTRITQMHAGSLARVEFDLPMERKAVLHWIIPIEAW